MQWIQHRRAKRPLLRHRHPVELDLEILPRGVGSGQGHGVGVGVGVSGPAGQRVAGRLHAADIFGGREDQNC